jgi:serine/threonine protein kinase
VPQLPRLVSDRYEIEEPLGQGGMGSVYRARDRVLDRTVAVKLLPAGMASDDQAADRL